MVESMNYINRVAYNDPPLGSEASSDTQNAPPQAAWCVQVQALEKSGQIAELARRIPATPQFEAAFGAFARGTLLQTEEALIAIEDVLPGDRLITADGRTETVLWIGKMRYTAQNDVMRKPLVRVLPDAFGPNRPENNTILGPYARLLYPAPGVAKKTDVCSVTTPASAFLDNGTVVEALPPTEVQLYHLILGRHAAVIAGGIAVETYHPGLHPLEHIEPRFKCLFPGLFPHVTHLADFGPLHYARSEMYP
ncbi:MAG: Hint domain-containing protein [Roseobacter sp.]